MNTLESYIKTMSERARTVYEKTESVMIEPGAYEVVESDGGGMRDIVQFIIDVQHPINKKDLAIKLLQELNYKSGWGFLLLREYNEPPQAKRYKV